MTRATVTPLAALKRLIAVAKTADAMGFEELGGWNTFQTELAVAEMVVRDWVEPKPFAHFVQPSSFGPFIECEASQVGSLPAHRAPVAAQPDLPKLPSTTAEALEFIGPNFESVEVIPPIEGCPEDFRVTLSGHDLLSAFQAYEDAAPAIAAPVEVELDAKIVEALHELALLMSDTIRGEYTPDSFTLQPAVHALASVGIEFPDDDYLLTQRETCVVVPAKPSAAMLKAMAESRAVDDEGEFPAMLDLLDFSGGNKTRTVLEAAYVAAIDAAIATGDKHE